MSSTRTHTSVDGISTCFDSGRINDGVCATRALILSHISCTAKNFRFKKSFSVELKHFSVSCTKHEKKRNVCMENQVNRM